MGKKLELSTEDRNMTIQFANNILPLAFEDVAQVIKSNKRALIQKRYMGADASTGMMTILIEKNRNFIVDVFVSSNRIHGKSYHLQAVKTGMVIEATIRNSRMVEEGSMALEGELIQALAEFLNLIEDDEVDSAQQIADERAVENMLMQIQEERKRVLIDQYLESGEFEKIIALQNGVEATGHLFS